MKYIEEIKDSFYKDYEECLEFLKKLNYSDYEYPEGKTNFHTYSEIRNEKELMVVKSFFATQNLEKSNFILWSDYDITNNPLLEPYKEFIDFRVFEPEKESKDTILENLKQHLNSNDQLYWLKSDLFRILITHKYGGVFTDMDFIYLNDFLPVLNLEFTYQWGSELDFINFGTCGTVMKLNKNSELSNLMMLELANSPIIPNTTVWGKDLFGKVYEKKKFSVLPCVFFNTEWMINKKYPGLSEKIEHSWFNKTEYSNNLFLEALGWHWHNTSHKYDIIEKGSKFDLLTDIMNIKLKSRGFN